MASVQNRVYPNAEFGEYRADIFRGTVVTGSVVTGSTLTTQRTYVAGTSVVYTGSIIITGFPAEGIIGKYQPVVIDTTTGSNNATLYVSGATAWAQAGLMGVSATSRTAGQTVDIIVRGLVPFITSGATTVTCGQAVVYGASGSVPQTGSTGWFTIGPLDEDALTTGSRCILGIAVTTGAASPNIVTNVWVCPGFY